jgi:hypothetical protein
MKTTDFFWALVIGLAAFVLTLGLTAPAHAETQFEAPSVQTDVQYPPQQRGAEGIPPAVLVGKGRK